MCVPSPSTAADVDGPAQGLDAVGEADQARAARRVGPADAVVADRQQQPAVARCERNLDARRLPMLRRVRQGLGGDVVRRDLDRLGNRASVVTSSSTGIAERRASVRNAGPRPPRERIAGWIPRESSCRSVTASTSPVAMRDSSARRSPRSGGTAASAARTARPSETSRCWVPSWRSRSIRRRASSDGGDDPPARGGKLGSAVRIRDRGGDQLGEGSEAGLRVRRRLLAGRRDHYRAPEAALDDDRRANGGDGCRGAAATGTDVVVAVSVHPSRAPGVAHEPAHAAFAEREAGSRPLGAAGRMPPERPSSRCRPRSTVR